MVSRSHPLSITWYSAVAIDLWRDKEKGDKERHTENKERQREREGSFFLLQSDTQCQPDLLHSQQANTETMHSLPVKPTHTCAPTPTQKHTQLSVHQ